MIDPALAVQGVIFERLFRSSDLPMNVVFDEGDPSAFPCIIIGEATTQYPDYYEDFHTVCTSDVHIWTEESNLASVKKLTGIVREALWQGPWTVDGHRCANLRIQQARYMRDPDGKHSHGILTVSAILQEDAQP